MATRNSKYRIHQDGSLSSTRLRRNDEVLSRSHQTDRSRNGAEVGMESHYASFQGSIADELVEFMSNYVDGA